MSEARNNRGNELSSLAKSYFDQEEYDQAEETLRQALTISIENNIEWLRAATLNNLGLISKSREQYSEALEFYNQSLAVYQQLNDSLAQAEVLDNIGFVHYSLEQYFEALEVYQEALSIYLTLNDPEGRNRLLLNMLCTIEAFLARDTDSSGTTSRPGFLARTFSSLTRSSARRAAGRPPLDRIWR